MSDFLKLMLLINAYVACTLTMFCLLVAPPAHADAMGFAMEMLTYKGEQAESEDGDD
jgi:hypothetical protein